MDIFYSSFRVRNIFYVFFLPLSLHLLCGTLNADLWSRGRLLLGQECFEGKDNKKSGVIGTNQVKILFVRNMHRDINYCIKKTRF